MDHTTWAFQGGSSAIPDAHGEFFIAPLAGALQMYDGHISAKVLAIWKQRLKTPLSTVLDSFTGHLNNWRTYAMKNEWSRFRAGLVAKLESQNFIEASWLESSPRERIASDKWNLYQDWSSDPPSHAVEAVGRGNLIGLMAEGYDGPSADQIWSVVRRGTRTSMILQDPSGQCPPNGRTDNHIFNDVLYAFCFEAMAEAYLARRSVISEEPTPAEIGGYGSWTDAAFSTFVANAGGMQVFCNLRGATIPKYGKS